MSFGGGWGDKNILDLESDDGCTSLQIYLKDWAAHVIGVNFMVREIYLKKYAYEKILSGKKLKWSSCNIQGVFFSFTALKL